MPPKQSKHHPQRYPVPSGLLTARPSGDVSSRNIAAKPVRTKAKREISETVQTTLNVENLVLHDGGRRTRAATVSGDLVPPDDTSRTNFTVPERWIPSALSLFAMEMLSTRSKVADILVDGQVSPQLDESVLARYYLSTSSTIWKDWTEDHPPIWTCPPM